MNLKYGILLVILLNLSNLTVGQDLFQHLVDNNYDSTYYDKLDNLLTTKIFLSSKLSEFSIKDKVLDKSLNYDSKATSSLGIGLGYKWIGLNVAFNVNNSSNISSDDSKWFNVQTQFYLRKFTINIYSTVYKGYYLDNALHMIEGYSQGELYSRGDISNSTFGISSYYIFNSSRYSNRATFNQNEWQKKTAGSFLAGGSILYNRISADSSLIPSQILYPTFLNSTHYNRSGYFGISGSLGYALSYVINKNWFFDANILLGLSVGNSTIHPEGSDKISSIKAGLNLSNRFGIGYNSKLFYAAINYNNMLAYTPLPIDKMSYQYKIGIVQMVVAYRFRIPEHNNILPDWSPVEL